jgi:hypothetical protein
MATDYWFVVTAWNDGAGQDRKQVEHWVDATEFSVKDLLKLSEAEKWEILQPIFRLDIPGGSAAEQFDYLASHYPDRLLVGVIVATVPIVANDGRFVHFEPVKTNRPPPKEPGKVIERRYGVTIYRLNEPWNIQPQANGKPAT